MLKLLTVWEYQTTLPASWDICMHVKKQQLEPDMEQQTGSRLGKEYVKAVNCHPAYLASMQSTSCKMPGWMNPSWNQDWQEKYQQPQICRWYHFNGRKQRETKEPLVEGEKREWQSWLKTQHSENYAHGMQSHHMANGWGWRGNSQGLDSILGLFMLIMFSHHSNGFWTLCLVPMETTTEG